MNLKCKIFGHKWDDDKYKKKCKRKDCLVEKFQVYHKYGNTRYSWKLFDFSRIFKVK